MQKHCSVGPLECIFIALPKIGSLCGLGGTSACFSSPTVWGTSAFFLPYGGTNANAPKRKKHCSVGLLNSIMVTFHWSP